MCTMKQNQYQFIQKKKSFVRSQLGKAIFALSLGLVSALYINWEVIKEGEAKLAQEREAARNKTK